jgi:hypothetical protein
LGRKTGMSSEKAVVACVLWDVREKVGETD